jgi:hypothetical protein
MREENYERFSAYLTTDEGRRELENLTAKVESQESFSLGLLGLNAFCTAGGWVVPDSVPGGWTVYSEPFAARVNLAAQHIASRFETR